MTRWPARRPPQVADAPERLVRFVPGEWPGDLREAYLAWKAARHLWHTEHVPKGGIGPLGDFIDMLRFERVTRRRLHAVHDPAS